MTALTTITRHQRHYSHESTMNDQNDKEERKREYNRLAQREFRRRRKEHMKNLELAQKEQNTEQSEEIERLRYQNEELRRENEALRTQLYGTPSHNLSVPINIPVSSDGRQYSLSPSISGTSLSGHGSPPTSLGADMMPISALSLTSSMITPPMQAYTEPTNLSLSQPYSMVHPSGIRHNSQSSPESSGFKSPRRTSMGPPFQSLNSMTSVEQPRRASGPLLVAVPCDRNKARVEMQQKFRALLSDPATRANPSKHLSVLQSMSSTLPSSLQPSKAQLDTPHYYGIDMLASPSLRERLLNVTPDIAQSFISEAGSLIGESEDVGQVIVWGDDPLNEVSWEFSQTILERWGWLLGKEWVVRANFWRRQRGAAPLPDW
ncbi:hypothetical protein BP5796_04146 [Coleophoma crateriformis]|uniref:BZIP domain-containing protein n=1 Tax=Coleophoma crateriformis TaxID=565419 RepID=A0A3D8SI21_9HELO|nr:hypothetical protein BP5796_04146 [Coleophoma crateriformis]